VASIPEKTEWSIKLMYFSLVCVLPTKPVMTEMASPETDADSFEGQVVTNFSQNLTGPIVRTYIAR
jgi:hypothetical protein